MNDLIVQQHLNYAENLGALDAFLGAQEIKEKITTHLRN